MAYGSSTALKEHKKTKANNFPYTYCGHTNNKVKNQWPFIPQIHNFAQNDHIIEWSQFWEETKETNTNHRFPWIWNAARLFVALNQNSCSHWKLNPNLLIRHYLDGHSVVNVIFFSIFPGSGTVVLFCCFLLGMGTIFGSPVLYQ